MNGYVLDFTEIDRTALATAGGKAANLGELSRIKGIRVPKGFCLTTKAYREIIESNNEFRLLLDELTMLKADDRKSIGTISAKIRALIEVIAIPEHIIAEITRHLGNTTEGRAYAVRSSATAEDLPTASFAGQQDTYLNIVGKASILKHISKCWASLFTNRAVTYRLQNGFDHKEVSLAVIIQEMIFSEAAGIMFTADPVTSNRKVLSIDAGYGLGEILVSGKGNADNYKLRDGNIIDRKVSTKKLAIGAVKSGGTKEQEISIHQQTKQVLSDAQILELGNIGRQIEAHFGNPQDIEWCLFDGVFHIVQSRPVTTLYPIPEANDTENHVYISVGHQQMMTDPMKPLGLSLWQLRAARPMFKAGGRLFIDVTKDLGTPTGKENLLEAMGQHDPLIKDALQTVIERGDFIKSLPDDINTPMLAKSSRNLSSADILAQAGSDPAIVADLIKQNEASVAALKQNIQTKSGTDLFDYIREDITQSKQMIFHAQHMGVIIAAMNAAAWLNNKMNEWLGERNVADILSQSVSNNITSEMGLALLDVADVIRPHRELVDFLQTATDDGFLDEMATFEGGVQSRDAINNFLERYGMRCAGEIDITRPRWSEKPITLVPLILSNIRNFELGAAKKKFDEGLQEALKKENELLTRLRQLPDGEQKANNTKAIIDLLRNFAGYREYPKYGIVNRFFIYKQALLKEIVQLVEANAIASEEDSYYLTFEELREMVRTHQPANQLIAIRKDEFKVYEKLTPPRVITSEGEIISGKYNHEVLPAGAIAGLAVSSGIAEGRARVILNIEDADIEAGDILVTTFTDPSWTPLFVSVKALITEVGGMMTHGAVIAREYGLPAVVGIEGATRLVKDGQRIRVNGTEGYIEII